MPRRSVPTFSGCYQSEAASPSVRVVVRWKCVVLYLLPRVLRIYAATRGRRVLPPCVTLGRHHKPFGSAGTARGLRALDLVGAAPRNVARRAPWAPEKGVDQDRRIIHTTVAPPACSGEPPERPYRRIDTGPAQHQLCGPGGHVSHRHRTHCKRRFGGGLQNTTLVFPSPRGTGRSHPTRPGEQPEHAEWPRRALRPVPAALSAGCLPPVI